MARLADAFAGLLRNNPRDRLIALVAAILAVAFLSVAVLNHVVSKGRLRDLIVSKELPLTSDVIYADIQREFTRAIRASAMMAGDTFLRDWAVGGEKDLLAIQDYLAEMQRVNSAFTAYFVSGLSHRYYTPRGVLKTVSRTDSHDGWFFDLQQGVQPYVVEVDTDQQHDNALTVFINYRVFDAQNRFIGVAGIGLNVDAVRAVLGRYKYQYNLGIFFVDRTGQVMMSDGREPFGHIGLAPGLSALAPDILAGQGGAFQYVAGGQTHLLNVRFMPELGWLLFVEQNEDIAAGGLRWALYTNLLIATAATALVAGALGMAAARYRAVLDKLISTDSLTEFMNRNAFYILFRQANRSRQRTSRQAALVLFDIDGLKRINEEFGHRAGDEVIKAVAAIIELESRPNDAICRWGDEEFLMLLQDCGVQEAMNIADAIRQKAAVADLRRNGKPMAVTLSAGIAEVFREEREDSAIARANQGLQAAKNIGGNGIISAGRRF